MDQIWAKTGPKWASFVPAPPFGVPFWLKIGSFWAKMGHFWPFMAFCVALWATPWLLALIAPKIRPEFSFGKLQKNSLREFLAAFAIARQFRGFRALERQNIARFAKAKRADPATPGSQRASTSLSRGRSENPSDFRDLAD